MRHQLVETSRVCTRSKAPRPSAKARFPIKVRSSSEASGCRLRSDFVAGVRSCRLPMPQNLISRTRCASPAQRGPTARAPRRRRASGLRSWKAGRPRKRSARCRVFIETAMRSHRSRPASSRHPRRDSGVAIRWKPHLCLAYSGTGELVDLRDHTYPGSLVSRREGPSQGRFDDPRRSSSNPSTPRPRPASASLHVRIHWCLRP